MNHQLVAGSRWSAGRKSVPLRPAVIPAAASARMLGPCRTVRQ